MDRNDIVVNGIKNSKSLKIAICSIVRDCDKNLKKNIPIINEITSYFKSSIVIIFENDSIDNTKQTLKEWSEKSSNVLIQCKDFGNKTIPVSTNNGVNKYFSVARINKMVEYRNNYLKKLEEINFNPDFVIVVDLDVNKIHTKGIFHSFGLIDQWDVVTANGYSMSPKFKRRYHDTYALVELGKENIPQTEESISVNAKKWNFLQNKQSLIPVFSAHGGLSIYRYEAMKKLRYRTIKNDDNQVEVRCEHFALCHDIREKGFGRIYINPLLELKYQSVDINLLKKYFRIRLNSIFKRRFFC
jgi:hypothetical protein